MSYTMPNADAKQLAKLDLALEAALAAGNDNAALEILQSKDYLRLLYLDELRDAGELSGNAFAAVVGARATLAMKYVSLAALRRRALEARIAALETAIPKYVGVYRSGETYAKGNITTHGGSLWIALQDTSTRPPGEHWQCCCQRGRDGGRS